MVYDLLHVACYILQIMYYIYSILYIAYYMLYVMYIYIYDGLYTHIYLFLFICVL